MKRTLLFLLLLAGSALYAQDKKSPLPFLDSVTDFHGFTCYEGRFEGRKACVVVPNGEPAKGKPWVWRTRFWGHEPQSDSALLARGYYVVYCDVAELFANEEALGIWDRFYQQLQKAGLHQKAAMFGMSRGGFYAYRWAVRYPDRVACVYADAPVLDIRSWPLGEGKGPGSAEVWETFKKDFGYKTEEEARRFKGNPLDLVPEIVKGGYPMLHICGDADEFVPIDENTDPFEKKVLAAGGRIQVIRKPGVKHHPHSLKDPAVIVTFVMSAYR
ncbi:alpha/beta hydrolase family protein [Chitinophaga barathri]|uniref:Alpha/beta hydrolase n=1 Tax=Chitinophaga barathri TaxID=1647451 RepID=A0A3N4MM24_9BACT|nr:prolyl oligopeptidase family serine peptidase [Chitinophaga barathri]RPD41110.1 alpha/beta hydrolase [Chitinophaga barathri]